VLDVKILPGGHLWSDEAILDLGLPWTLASVHGHSISHDGVVGTDGIWCGLDQVTRRMDLTNETISSLFVIVTHPFLMNSS
jgi:hypothetical protein